MEVTSYSHNAIATTTAHCMSIQVFYPTINFLVSSKQFMILTTYCT